MKVFCNNLKVDKVIDTPFLLKKKELAMTKSNKPFLKLEFADNSGVIEGRMWDRAEIADRAIDTGIAVIVKGIVTEFKGNIQIKVDDVYPADENQYEHSDLVRCVDDIDGLFEKVKKSLDLNLSNNWVRLLTKSFFDDQELMDAYKFAPGARSWHNAYVGGLMEHSYEVMQIVEKMCELYPSVNRDIAIFGAFLHDVGKIFELDKTSFEYTHNGGLIGHIGLGFELLSAKIKEISSFPEELAMNLKHIILSHHGEYEQQSPVLPKTIEAIIVYHSDDLVSQTNAVNEIISAQSYAERDWSNFISIKNRKFFLKRLGKGSE